MSDYLTFELQQLTYAITATAVREIFPLPELVPVADAPGDTIGLLNLRGRIVPIIHLAKRLGQDAPPCRPSDRVILIEWDELFLGVVVDAVKDVVNLAPGEIATEPEYGRTSALHSAFVGGVVQIGEVLTVVLAPDALVRDVDGVAALTAIDPESELPAPTDFYTLHLPEATVAERALLRERALALRPTLSETQGGTDNVLLAVFRLGGEFFGLDVRHVREFIRLPQLTPVPCCPPHILGNANLRGDILTLIDVRKVLNLPAGDRTELTRSIVVEVGETIAGIVTGEVFDVLSLPVGATRGLPTAGQAFLCGTAQHGDRLLGIIDLPELLARGGLIVNESVA